MASFQPQFSPAPYWAGTGLPKARAIAGPLRTLPWFAVGVSVYGAATYAASKLRSEASAAADATAYAQRLAAEQERKKALDLAYGDRDSLARLEDAMKQYEATRTL